MINIERKEKKDVTLVLGEVIFGVQLCPHL